MSARDELRRLLERQRAAEAAIEDARGQLELADDEQAQAVALEGPAALGEADPADVERLRASAEERRAAAQREIGAQRAALALLEGRVADAETAVAREDLAAAAAKIERVAGDAARLHRAFSAEIAAAATSAATLQEARAELDSLHRDVRGLAERAGVEAAPLPDETWAQPAGWESLVDVLKAGPVLPTTEWERQRAAQARWDAEAPARAEALFESVVARLLQPRGGHAVVPTSLAELELLRGSDLGEQVLLVSVVEQELRRLPADRREEALQTVAERRLEQRQRWEAGEEAARQRRETSDRISHFPAPEQGESSAIADLAEA